MVPLKNVEKVNVMLAKLTWGYLHLLFPLLMALHFHFLFSSQSFCCPSHALLGVSPVDDTLFLTVWQLDKVAEAIPIKVIN